MIRGRCPICEKAFQIENVADLPTFPFCSGRCRLVDLGRWIDGAYAIPGSEVRSEPEERGGDDDDESVA